MTDEPMRWGIYDPDDHCWYGDDHGPKLFEGEFAQDMARAAATVLVFQFGFAHRAQAREYTEDATRMRDEVPMRMSTLEALRRAEREDG